MKLLEVHLIGSEPALLAPVVTAIGAAGRLFPVLITAGQHPALAAFDLVPDLTLDPTEPLAQLDNLWAERPPAAVIVQGDTAIPLAAAMAAAWRRIPIVHLEAGLHSTRPTFPREANQRLITQVAALHLAPTPLAAMNVLDEGIAAADVLITGSTTVDAAVAVAARNLPYENPALAEVNPDRKLILVTTRPPIDQTLSAVRHLTRKYPDIEVVLSSRPAPGIRGLERITCTGPLAFADLVRVLAEAHLVLNDPGEELVRKASSLLDSPIHRTGGTQPGDGLAASRIAQATAALLGLAERPQPMPSTQPATENART